MRVLGIDPGTHRLGWGIIEGNRSRQSLVAAGCLDLPPHTQTASYLQTLAHQLQNIISRYQPHQAGVEKIFFQKNVKTAISVAQARGVVLLVLAEAKVPFQEFSPNTIKSAVAGNGNADKKQVAKMVEILLNLNTSLKLDDTYDALAAAITTLVTT